jgi:hypothetical protein
VATLVTVLKSGGRYDARWVERLAKGVQRHAPAFERVLCLTDLPLACAGFETVPLQHDWPRWWAKFEAFRPGLAEGTIVLCDLDTVFTGPADALAEEGFAAMEDYFLKGRVSSAFIRWNSDELAFLYERFQADPAFWMREGSCGTVPNSVHGDQVVIDHFLREAGRLPDFLQDRHPGLLDFYDPECAGQGPVVVFIGDAKPDGANEDVRQAWAA